MVARSIQVDPRGRPQLERVTIPAQATTVIVRRNHLPRPTILLVHIAYINCNT